MKTQTEVLVIGGGAIGVCTAYYLWKNGITVSIVEKNQVGSGCSDKNAGYVVPSHFISLASPGLIGKGLKWMLNPESPFHIKPRLDLDLLSWLWKFRGAANDAKMRSSMPIIRDLNYASLALYEELTKLEGLEFGFQKKGLAILHNTIAGEKDNIDTARFADELSVEAKIMDNRQLNELEPNIHILANGGLFFPDDAHLDPTLFVQNLAKYLKNAGVPILTETEVLGFETKNGSITSLRTSKGNLSADQYVLASGSWTPGIAKGLELKIPVQAGKGYSVTIPNLKKKPEIPFILSEARVAITPLGDKLRVGGTLELAGIDSTINYRRVNALLQAVPRYFSDFDPETIDRSDVWSGLRPCSPDGLPYIGRFITYGNLIAATGHAMMGLSLAPITGKLVSEIIKETIPSIDLSLLKADRYA